MRSKKSATVTPLNLNSSPDRHSAFVVSPKGEFSLQKAVFAYRLIQELSLDAKDVSVPRASGMDVSP
jgi:hypothetical protein